MASTQISPVHLRRMASQPITIEIEIAQEICRTVTALQRRALTAPPTAEDAQVVEGIVALGLRPDILPALQGRQDRREAIRDLATSYAFRALMEQGQPIEDLDALSQRLIHRALDVIHKRARQLEHRRGENPLEIEPDLIYRICTSLARYTPTRPMGALIQYKLEHCESAVSRTMRQIKHLVKQDEVTEAFVDHVLASTLTDAHKARLLQLARGGGLRGLDYEATIRFFAQPETVALVKTFAATLQTARTFYVEEEYAGIDWQGSRRLPAGRRQGYLEAALAELERPHDVWLDQMDDEEEGTNGRHEIITNLDTHTHLESRFDLLHKESFEVWITRQALDARPDDSLWQAGRWLYLEGLSAQEVVRKGLADPAAVEAVQARMEAIHADADVWNTWVTTTIG